MCKTVVSARVYARARAYPRDCILPLATVSITGLKKIGSVKKGEKKALVIFLRGDKQNS